MRPRNRDGVDSKSVRVSSDWNVIGLGELGSWNVIGCCNMIEVRVRHCVIKIPIRRRRQSAKHLPFSTRAFLLMGFSSVDFRSSDSSSWLIFSISTRTEESIAGVMLLIMSFVSVFVSLSKDCDAAERISKGNRFFASCWTNKRESKSRCRNESFCSAVFCNKNCSNFLGIKPFELKTMTSRVSLRDASGIRSRLEILRIHSHVVKRGTP